MQCMITKRNSEMLNSQEHQRKYQRYRVFGQISATRGYTSRAPNGGCGIRIPDKYSEDKQSDPPQEIKTFMAAEIAHVRTQIHVRETAKQDDSAATVRNNSQQKRAYRPTSEMHNCAKMGARIFPYLPESFRNIPNIKHHMINNSFTNKQPGSTTVHWEDIVEHNRTLEAPHRTEEKNDHDRGTFERAKLRFCRIQVTGHAEGVSWECASRTYATDTDVKLRNRL